MNVHTKWNSCTFLICGRPAQVSQEFAGDDIPACTYPHIFFSVIKCVRAILRTCPTSWKGIILLTDDLWRLTLFFQKAKMITSVNLWLQKNLLCDLFLQTCCIAGTFHALCHSIFSERGMYIYLVQRSFLLVLEEKFPPKINTKGIFLS